jgi:hypothetical protein
MYHQQDISIVKPHLRALPGAARLYVEGGCGHRAKQTPDEAPVYTAALSPSTCTLRLSGEPSESASPNVLFLFSAFFFPQPTREFEVTKPL